MSKLERSFAVSTDSSGLLGTPSTWKHVWKDAFDFPNFKGFEMIGWGGRFRFWTQFLLQEAEKHGCTIVGMHGRIGNEQTSSQFSNIKARFGNLLLVPDHDLLAQYGSQLEYVLLHVPECEENRTQQIVTEHAQSIRLLFLENHLAIGSLGKTVEIARQLYAQGVNTGIMFDLFHYFNSHNKTLSPHERWKELMMQLHWLLNTANQDISLTYGVHLPMGTNKQDSFGDEIDDAMWKEFGSIIAQHPNVLLVLENRQKGFDQLAMNSMRASQQRHRNAQLLETLSRTSIL